MGLLKPGPDPAEDEGLPSGERPATSPDASGTQTAWPPQTPGEKRAPAIPGGTQTAWPPIGEPAVAPPGSFDDVALVRSSVELYQSPDRYEVLKQLGRGGMGEVHLCLDRRIGRQIARKQRTRGSGELKRFLREVSVQGQLEHPCIVPLHDVGVGDDGEIYFTMKVLRGQTLGAILRARRAKDAAALEQFPIKRLLHAFSSVCLGVAFAHSRGVVHRDLKPDNLMLGEFGEVYILDWGVAKLRESQEADDEILNIPLRGSMTTMGSMIGTPGYMSPEQCVGVADVDERSDVYSLGAILFEILAGEALHSVAKDSSLHGGTPLERIDSTLLGVDVRAAAASWGREVADLIEPCAVATALHRDDRMATARALGEAVEKSLSREPIFELRRPSKMPGPVTTPDRAADTIAPPKATTPAEPMSSARSEPELLALAGALLALAMLLHALLAGESWTWRALNGVTLALLLVVAAGGRR
jgi:serine/threonine protein kinase